MTTRARRVLTSSLCSEGHVRKLGEEMGWLRPTSRALFPVALLLAVAMSGCATGSGTPSKSPADCGARVTSSAPTSASSTPADSGPFVVPTESLNHADADFMADEKVPAGGSIDVPVSFECSSSAGITAYSPTAGLSASINRTALTSSDTSDTLLSTTLPNPVDGTLHLVNPGTTDATVSVTILINTTRHLTVTPSAYSVVVGVSVSLDIQLSEAADGDGATAYLQDPSGTKTPIALTKVGTGHWTGQVTPTVSGDNKISAQTTGDRVRYDSADISV